jgi:hypothetical protein
MYLRWEKYESYPEFKWENLLNSCNFKVEKNMTQNKSGFDDANFVELVEAEFQ